MAMNTVTFIFNHTRNSVLWLFPGHTVPVTL